MTFPVLGGNGAVAGAFSIDNSLRFNDDDSSNLTKDFSSEGDRRTWTWSAWVKRSNLTGAERIIFDSRQGGNANPSCGIAFTANETLDIMNYSGGINFRLTTNQVFRDTSAWFHILFRINTTDSTADDRVQLYVNGQQVTSFSSRTNPSQNYQGAINDNARHAVGSISYGGNHFDGYMAEVHFIDGTAKSPTDFGEFDEDSGIWKPKEYEGTYGTNGFYLDFENSGSLGADQSGNGNNFTPTNLTSTDQTTDTPTNNFATFNALFTRTSVNPTFSEGNLKVVQGDSNGIAYSTQGVSSGKWYAEIKVDNVGTATSCGILEPSAYDNGNPDTQAIFYQSNGNKVNKGSISSYGASYTTGDIIGIAFDADNGTLAFYKNGVSQGTAFTGLDTNTTWLIGCHGYGSSSSQSGNYGNPPFAISSGNSDANGYGNFEYSTSGYLALCTQNLATALSPTIDDGSQYFNTVLYSGTGATRSITGLGFSPDWTWIKERNNAISHRLFDSVRGATKRMFSNNTDAESTQSNSLTSFDSDGFTLGDSGSVNGGSDTYVAWNWRGSDSSAVSNTDGSITSTVSANQTSGFSVVTYTGTGSNATIGHGLGKVPAMMIVKKRSGADDWAVYHNGVLTPSDARYHYVQLNTTNAYAGDGTYWNDTAPTTSVFTVGTNADVNTSGATYVAYIFTDIEGYSKFGKYTGNGTGTFGPFANGPFVYTGFKPAWVMIKRIDGGNGWNIFDTARNPTNIVEKQLFASSNGAEEGDASHHAERDYLSNGFKLKGNGNDINANGANYLYMAFAENPFVTSTGVPVTAR